jgi:hypothetical protein
VGTTTIPAVPSPNLDVERTVAEHISVSRTAEYCASAHPRAPPA